MFPPDAQWRNDVALGTKYWTFTDGLRAMITCDWVTRDFAHWREGVPWMTCYFGAVPCVSTLMMRTKLPPGPAAKM